MIATDGGVFAFGDAAFHGSTGNLTLNQPVVGIAPDPDNTGYWLIAADGGIFAYEAQFRGSVPGVLADGVTLNRPVIGGIAYGDGYLMVASDGGIFNFSPQDFLGSLGSNPPPGPHRRRRRLRPLTPAGSGSGSTRIARQSGPGIPPQSSIH